MMKPLQLMTMLYGLTAIGVGVWRHLDTQDSPQAIWFGVVFGGLAILGAFSLKWLKRLPAFAMIALSLLFVGGWFIRRLAMGHDEGLSPRIILILVMCTLEAAVLLRTAITSSRS